MQQRRYLLIWHVQLCLARTWDFPQLSVLYNFSLLVLFFLTKIGLFPFHYVEVLNEYFVMCTHLGCRVYSNSVARILVCLRDSCFTRSLALFPKLVTSWMNGQLMTSNRSSPDGDLKGIDIIKKSMVQRPIISHPSFSVIIHPHCQLNQ